MPLRSPWMRRKAPAPVKYDAFISYNHAVDNRLGPAVRDGLHQFARPWYRPRALRVFCDRRSMSATDGLWPTVEAALNDSACLIVLASPESADSIWVQREVQHWQHIEPKRPILIGLTKGEIAWDHVGGDFDWGRTTALPESLHGWFIDEPLWIDLTNARREEDISLKNPDFLDLIATISSALHRRNKDELIGEDIKQHKRTKRFRRLSWASLSIITTLAVIAATVAFSQRSNALNQRDTALANQLVAEAGTIQDTQPGLARQLIAAAHQLKPTPQVESAVIGSGLIPQEIHVEASALAYSSDGRLLAVTRRGRSATATHPAVIGHIWLYDTASLTVVSEWSMETMLPISAVAFSPSAHLLAGAHGHDVVLWDVTDPRAPVKRDTLTGHGDNVKAVSFSPNGRHLASGSRDGTMRLWDVSGVTPSSSLSVVTVESGGAASFSLRFQPSGHLLGVVAHPLVDLPNAPSVAATDAVSIVSGPGAKFGLWDVADARSPQRVAPTVDKFDSVDFATDGSRLVTHASKELRLWNVGSDATLTTPTALPMRSTTISIKKVVYGVGDQIAAVGDDGYIRLWDVSQDPALIAEIPVPVWDSYNFAALTFSPDGKSLAMASSGSNAGPGGAGVSGGTVRIWNVADGRERRAVAVLKGHTGEVSHPVVSPDHRTLATSANDGTVRLWDVSEPMNPQSLAIISMNDGQKVSFALAFSPDGSALAAVGDDTVRLMDIRNKRNPELIGTWHTQDKRGLCRSYPSDCSIVAVAVAFSGDGRLLAVGDVAAQVALYDTTRPEVSEPMGTILTEGWNLAFLPDSDPPVLATAGLSKRTKLWDVSDPAHAEKLADTAGHTYQIQDMAFHPAGRALATASRDGTVRLWTVEDGQRLTESAVITDTGDVNSLAFSPNGNRLATIGRDRTFRVYDITDGKPILMVIVHVGNVASTEIAFVRNDRTLAISTAHGVIDIWDLDTAAALRRLCVGVGQPITPEQWSRAVPDLPYRPPC